MLPGRGPALCAGTTRRGPCLDLEIEGYGYCLRHVDDLLLADAERVAGFRRCRTRFGQFDACLNYALSYTDDEPACRVHCSGFMRRIEHWRHFKNEVEIRRTEIMTALLRFQDGDRSHPVLHELGLCECAVQRLAAELMAEARSA